MGKKKNKPRIFGHRAGVKALKSIIRLSSDINVKILTLYAFSTENWKRPKKEVDGLMNLLVEFFKKEIDELNRNKVKINVLGDINLLPPKSKNSIINAISLTKNNKGLILNVAINYGGRDEIITGIKNFYEDVINNNYKIEDLNENIFSNYLYTSGQDEPDLIIRTSGELRLSNFLIWQCAYSELWFSDVFWPDFSQEEYYHAIYDYQQRKRKFGGINS